MKRKLTSSRPPAMRLNPIMAALSLLAVAPLPATAVICSGPGASPEHGATTVSGEATFTLTGVSPKTLTLFLKNTTTPPTPLPGDTLTGIVFDIGNNTAVLSYNAPANPTLGGPNMYPPGALGGSWTNVLTSTAQGHYGVATTGFAGLFNAGSITLGNGGPNYSIVSGTTDPGFAQGPFIQDSLQFQFTTNSVFTVDDITSIKLLFGTAGGAPIPCRPPDFGDAPDIGPGTGPGNYQTLLSDNGPRHLIVPGLTLGTVIDGENDGQPNAAANGDDVNGSPDDEDAVVGSLSYGFGAIGPSATITVTNSLAPGQPAFLQCWMDLNGDGDFVDAGEASGKTTIPASSGTANYPVTFPGTVTTPSTTYMRCRVSLTTGEVDTPTGPATSGEVEDHAVTVQGRDYGDLPEGTNTYGTTNANNGAYHTIIASNPILGSIIDGEADGQPNVAANGDDNNPPAPDDEDGVTSPLTFSDSQAPEITVQVSNPAATSAFLACWMDLNANGSFDAGERETTTINSGYTGPVNLTFNSINVAAGVTQTYLRCRISADGNLLGATGYKGPMVGGEVEDYRVTIDAASFLEDYGDAPDENPGTSAALNKTTPADYQTRLDDGGPSHTLGSPVFLGAKSPDGDSGDLQDPTASADDDTDTGVIDDEDGITKLPTIIIPAVSSTVSLSVGASNTTGGPATLACWIDFNRDGIFADSERKFVTVATGASNSLKTLLFPITPASFNSDPNIETGPTAIRCRISTDAVWGAAPTAVGGPLMNGEVEDYMTTIYRACNTSVVTSLPAAVTPPPYSGVKFTVNGGSPLTGPITSVQCQKTLNIDVAGMLLVPTPLSTVVGPIGTPPTWTFATPASAVEISARKASTASATIACTAADASGNVCSTDPWFATALRLKGNGPEVTANERVATVNGSDDYVTITNGSPGVRKLEITVNSTKFKVNSLQDGEMKTLCITSGMEEGEHNTIELVAKGRPGGSAEVVGVPSEGKCDK